MNDGDRECASCGSYYWSAQTTGDLCRFCKGAPDDESMALFLKLILSNRCIVQIEPIGSAEISIMLTGPGVYFSVKGTPRDAVQRSLVRLESILAEPPSMRAQIREAEGDTN